jgi:hypothetical protein
MAELTKTLDKQIGGDRFEIACISYEGVREASGFQRRVLTTRPQYKVNDKVVSRAVFFTMKDAAKAAS